MRGRQRQPSGHLPEPLTPAPGLGAADAGEPAPHRLPRAAPPSPPADGSLLVTAVEYQQKRPDRVNVYLNGAFGLAVAATVAQDAGLRRGLRLTPEDIARLRERDDFRRAYDLALNYLSYRPRSEAEVRQSLTRRAIAPERVAEVLERLRAAGLLDDAAFARYWVENRDAFSPRGARALKAELKQKGVADEVAREAASSERERDDAAAAYAAGESKARQLEGLDQPTFRRRLGGYLARRGFDYETIAPVLNRLWQEHGGEAGAGEEGEE